MCGIFGCLNFRITDLDKARSSRDKLTHRGPDQFGEWYSDFAYFGHRRLSIIDLSEQGKQPFVDEEAVVMVNGEIYNFRELRTEIGNDMFRSSSDSEVILHGFKLWGIKKLLEKIEGMYVIVIYEPKKRKTIIARDRFGKKPLFYSKINDKFIFSSEVKSLLEFEDELRAFSFEGIKSWIMFRGIHDRSTIFSKIHRLNPSECMIINDSLDVKHTTYYDILDFCHKKSDYNTDKIEGLVKKSIMKRLISDVPIGIQLSGGIDSSLITGYTNDLSPESLNTFSVIYDEKEYPGFSEGPYSNHVAKKWGNKHHEFCLDASQFKSNFKKTLYFFDGMLDYPNSVPLFLLSKKAKETVTVFLTGEGADEIFGGYFKFKNYLNNVKGKHNLINISKRFNLRNIRFLNKYIRLNYLREKYSDETAALNYLNSYISPETFYKFFGEIGNKPLDFVNKDKFKEISTIKKLRILDTKTYLFSLLERQDRVTMAASMEARLPFLDKDLTEYTMSLPDDDLLVSNITKKPLKILSEKMYGKKFTHRRKVGFPVPIDVWMQKGNILGEYVDRIFDGKFLISKFVDMKSLSQWFDDKSFDYKLLNYQDSEKIWFLWYLMILRETQNLFSITDIKED